MPATESAYRVLCTAEGTPIRCPKCHEATVRYADVLRFRDMLVRFVKLDAVRCRSCRNRFYTRTATAVN